MTPVIASGQESMARGSDGQHAGIWGVPQQQRRLPKSGGIPAAAVGLRGARCVWSARCLHQLPAAGGPHDTKTLPSTHGTTSPNSAPGPARHSPFRGKKTHDTIIIYKLYQIHQHFLQENTSLLKISHFHQTERCYFRWA